LGERKWVKPGYDVVGAEVAVDWCKGVVVAVVFGVLELLMVAVPFGSSAFCEVGSQKAVGKVM
jgi:hypothetical protein